jgi:C-terminal processing protease CtpA/Prc
MDHPWEDVLEEFIPKMVVAKDAIEYTLTVAELVTHIQDSHGFIRSSILNKYLGSHSPSVAVKIVEDQFVITAILEDSAKKSGLSVGDIILKVDGEDIQK